MALFPKPLFNTVWASSGAVAEPPAAKVAQGWVVEIPPHEYDNWENNRQDQLLAHLNQVGIPQWDATVEYQAGKSYVQGTSTGVVYRAILTNTAINPELDVNGNWAVAFDPSGVALLKAQNLADVPDKALARQNLGIATTADYDLRYLRTSQNLGDVPNKATARQNLEIYSRQEVVDLLNAANPAGEVAPFTMQTAPSGWLVCNGAAVSRTTYARLFAAIGTRFGAGNGTTTFNVPNLLGEFVRGWDGGRGVDIGRGFGTFQADEIRQHAHNGVPFYSPDTDRGIGNASMFSLDDVGITGYTGGAETRPRNVALLYCIRT